MAAGVTTKNRTYYFRNMILDSYCYVDPTPVNITSIRADLIAKYNVFNECIILSVNVVTD